MATKSIAIQQNQAQAQTRSKKLSSWFLAIGVLLFVWHNPYQPLLQYAFLPWIGTILLIVSIVLTIGAKGYKFNLGSKRVWIPLAVISVSVALSGVFNQNTMPAISLATMFFGVYLVARETGTDVLQKIAPWVVVIESVSIPIWGATHHWSMTGGLISPTNYDIATGLIVFFTLMAKKEQWWWLATIGTIGLLFSGSAEAVFIGSVLLVVVVVRKLMHRVDVSWPKVLAPVMVIVVIGLATIPTGLFVKFQAPNMQRLSWLKEATGLSFIPSVDMSASEQVGRDASLDNIFGQRLTHFKISPIRPFGYGINLTHFYYGIPHNVVLIIIEQVGVIAALAWLAVAIQGIANKKWRYVWVGFVLLGLLDHFIFTQAAPWLWVLAGITFIKSEVTECQVQKQGAQVVTSGT